MLTFTIVSSRIVESVEKEKKYVAYTLRVELRGSPESPKKDLDPVLIERRYTQFADLYNALKKDFPDMIGAISFPRKIVMGNFEPNLIAERSEAFRQLLYLITSELRLREPSAVEAFLQNPELEEARKLIAEKNYEKALDILEISFKLLNKVYTDRSRIVMCSLCRVVACAAAGGLAARGERWALLALRRYEGVSDSDLLLIYVPLLHTCVAIWDTLGLDKSKLVDEINRLQRRGMKTDSVPTLMEAVDGLSSMT